MTRIFISIRSPWARTGRRLGHGYSVVKRTLRAGLSQGVDVIEVRHGDFRFVVVPTRGMGIWRACLGDMHLGWKSPVRGPVNPAYRPYGAPRRAGLAGWL